MADTNLFVEAEKANNVTLQALLLSAKRSFYVGEEIVFLKMDSKHWEVINKNPRLRLISFECRKNRLKVLSITDFLGKRFSMNSGDKKMPAIPASARKYVYMIADKLKEAIELDSKTPENGGLQNVEQN